MDAAAARGRRERKLCAPLRVGVQALAAAARHARIAVAEGEEGAGTEEGRRDLLEQRVGHELPRDPRRLARHTELVVQGVALAAVGDHARLVEPEPRGVGVQLRGQALEHARGEGVEQAGVAVLLELGEQGGDLRAARVRDRRSAPWVD